VIRRRSIQASDLKVTSDTGKRVKEPNTLRNRWNTVQDGKTSNRSDEQDGTTRDRVRQRRTGAGMERVLQKLTGQPKIRSRSDRDPIPAVTILLY
jgi:hypothetical protein